LEFPRHTPSSSEGYFDLEEICRFGTVAQAGRALGVALVLAGAAVNTHSHQRPGGEGRGADVQRCLSAPRRMIAQPGQSVAGYAAAGEIRATAVTQARARRPRSRWTPHHHRSAKFAEFQQHKINVRRCWEGDAISEQLSDLKPTRKFLR